jgi:hypothetical protein
MRHAPNALWDRFGRHANRDEPDDVTALDHLEADATERKVIG